MPYLPPRGDWTQEQLDDTYHEAWGLGFEIQPTYMAGGLNFLMSALIAGYIHRAGVSYQICNDIVGALDNAKDEFRRKVQHPYEDQKENENGYVYDREAGLTPKA